MKQRNYTHCYTIDVFVIIVYGRRVLPELGSSERMLTWNVVLPLCVCEAKIMEIQFMIRTVCAMWHYKINANSSLILQTTIDWAGEVISP